MNITKMESLGNDFIIVDYASSIDYTTLAPKILDRRLGVGADLLIVVKNNPLEMVLYNNLGNRELMDSNALACFIKYAYDNRLIRAKSIKALTGQGYKEIEIIEEIPFLGRLNLGVPSFNNSMLYVNDSLSCMGRIIKVDGIEVNTYSVNIGGPQTVVFIDSFDSKYIELAEGIAFHKLFMRHTNVTFVVVKNKLNLKCKSYLPEKGFVKASADGAAASLVIANKLDLCKGKAHIELENGSLYLEIGKKNNVYVALPARKILTGSYMEEEIC